VGSPNGIGGFAAVVPSSESVTIKWRPGPKYSAPNNCVTSEFSLESTFDMRNYQLLVTSSQAAGTGLVTSALSDHRVSGDGYKGTYSSSTCDPGASIPSGRYTVDQVCLSYVSGPGLGCRASARHEAVTFRVP
jgi:hypothetical protein